MPIAQTKTADSKGRVTLGAEFANQSVSVERVNEYEYTVKMVTMIPKKQAWLYENQDALTAVRAGLKQARERKFAKGPDLKRANAIARRIEE